jgi:hypothetical protein
MQVRVSSELHSHGRDSRVPMRPYHTVAWQSSGGTLGGRERGCSPKEECGNTLVTSRHTLFLLPSLTAAQNFHVTFSFISKP